MNSSKLQSQEAAYMEKVLLTGAVVTTGGCGVVNGYTINEMLFAIVVILALCLVWQVSVVLWQCRIRRKHVQALLRVRRCTDGKPC